MIINYQKALDRTIEQLNGRTPHLLLHSCCAPCSSYCLEYLSQYFEITVFYYNPNIFPPEEYSLRVEEQQRLAQQLPHANPIHFMEGEYNPDCFFEAVRGLENEKEGGARCKICFEMRLRRAALAATQLHSDYFTTTLSISPLKDAQLLNQLGAKIGAEMGVAYLHSDFKKRNGYQRSTELSKQYGLYRQSYCGCVFSRQDGALQ